MQTKDRASGLAAVKADTDVQGVMPCSKAFLYVKTKVPLIQTLLQIFPHSKMIMEPEVVVVISCYQGLPSCQPGQPLRSRV